MNADEHAALLLEDIRERAPNLKRSEERVEQHVLVRSFQINDLAAVDIARHPVDVADKHVAVRGGRGLRFLVANL